MVGLRREPGSAHRIVFAAAVLVSLVGSPSHAAPEGAPQTPMRDGAHGPSAPGRVIMAPKWLLPPHSPRNANYTIHARLNPTTKTITATQVLHWTNITDTPTSELRYHLYYNAWRNDRSSWLRAGGRSREPSEGRLDDGWALSDVETIRLLGDAGADLTAGARFVAPDDGNVDDRTVLAVPLPRPVGPGESIDVELSWTSKVPRTFARTGFRGDYFFIAQWFPKVGVLEAGGHWNCHQFIQTEFFSDFGVYDVALTVPQGWVVGASGKLQSEVSADDGMVTHRFVAEDVHDFAWVTTPHFSVHTDRFEYPDLPAVDIRLLLMPDHAAHRERYIEATKVALEHYGNWWGPYPYDHITVVDPAWSSGSGGMEYPTLFTGGTQWLSPALGRSPEGVTVHEAGHQFWYGIVANNEFEHAWLDEGFNTYSTSRTMEAAFPEHAMVERYFEGFLPVVFPSVIPPERTAGADQHVGMYSDFKRDPQGRDSWRTGPDGYKVNAYEKGAMTLRTLENHLGWNVFQRVMATYFREWGFRHPKPEDFFRVADAASGQELGWFFDQLQQDSVIFDYAVDRVSSRSVTAQGYHPAADGALEVAQRSGEDTKPQQYDNDVYVRRWGEGVFPVSVEAVFEDGTRKRARWDGKERWFHLSWTHPAKIERVLVDPERVLILDTNFTNNSWLAESKAPLAATKWSSKWMVYLQHTMEALAFFS